MADKSVSEQSTTQPLAKNNNLEMGEVSKANGDNNTNNDYIEFQPSGWFETTISRVGSSKDNFFKKNSTTLHVLFYFVLNGIIIGYYLGCLYYYLTFVNEPLELCSGFGSLTTVFGIIYFILFYFYVVKKFFGAWFEANVWNKVEIVWGRWWGHAWFRWCLSILVLAAIAALLIIDTIETPERLISLLGLAIILGLGFLFSAHPGRVQWHSVLSGLLLQFIFGLVFIRWTAGRAALQCFSDVVATFLSYGIDGSQFAFGELLVRTERVFAFTTLPVIFFFSMLVEMLFFWGAIQWFCLKLGQLLRVATATTVCESVICVANVFLGNVESLVIIKPYVSLLTPSEMHVIMASGLATVSGTILAAFIGFGADPAHLVTASVMSAPAAICYAKLMLPETQRSLTSVHNIQPVVSQDQSALSAATRGASNGVGLVLNIIANIIAFVAFTAFINGVLGYLGGQLGEPGLSLEWLMGKIFIPLCWVMGVPWAECELVGTLVGLKTVVNEFVAYQRMGELKALGLLSPRAELVATYALCGFTNPSSAAIMIGAISAMAPNQRETVSNVAVRAFFAASCICFMTACIAALLMPEEAFNNN